MNELNECIEHLDEDITSILDSLNKCDQHIQEYSRVSEEGKYAKQAVIEQMQEGQQKIFQLWLSQKLILRMMKSAQVDNYSVKQFAEWMQTKLSGSYQDNMSGTRELYDIAQELWDESLKDNNINMSPSTTMVPVFRILMAARECMKKVLEEIKNYENSEE